MWDINVGIELMLMMLAIPVGILVLSYLIVSLLVVVEDYRIKRQERKF